MIFLRLDERMAVPWGEKLPLYFCKIAGFCLCLLCLQYVQVHFVPIKVCVIWRNNNRIEPECFAWQYFDKMGHHGDPMEGWLPVE